MTDTQKPLRVLSLGWGVQSWTLAAMAAMGEIDIDVALHSDTYWEKEKTYAFIKQWTPWLETRGVKVVTVDKPQQAVVKVTTSSTDIPAFTNGALAQGKGTEVAPTGSSLTDYAVLTADDMPTYAIQLVYIDTPDPVPPCRRN